jgi:hypothetical protein
VQKSEKIQLSSGGRERELGMDVGIRGSAAVRATGTAGLGARTQRLIDDRLDGARAPAAFGAATEAAIELLGAARKIVRSVHGFTDIVVAEDVAGTNNHEKTRRALCCGAIDIEIETRRQKKKLVFEGIPNC